MQATNKVTTELPQVLQDSIQKIVAKEGFTTYNMDAKNICTESNNFLGELYEINISGETDQGNKILNIFAKLIIKNDDFKIYSIPEVYEKEAFLYLELRKIFKKLQDDENVPINNRLNLVKSYEETNSECILLENLSKRDFKIMPRMEIMSLEFARQGVAELAKFHGLSFVLEKRNPNYYAAKIKSMKQSFIYEEPWYDFVNKVYDISVSKLDDATKARVDKFCELSSEKYPKYMNGQTSTLKCLCHGDYKMNNILYKEENGRITNLVPIDFQQIYYGCPIIDLIYFIYAASDHSFRKNNLNALRDHYYEVLTSFLKYFDINFECSKPDFDQYFENSMEYALMFTLYMLPMFYVVDEKPSAKDNIMELSLNVDDRFHVRMKEIVDEFIEMNII